MDWNRKVYGMKKDIQLDEAAQKLFESLDGIDITPSSTTGTNREGDLSSALGEEETRRDEWRIVLLELASRLAGHLSGLKLKGITEHSESEINELFDYISKLAQMPDRGKDILLRFRGMSFSTGGKTSEEPDYVLSFGPVTVDIPIAKAAANRRGLTASHLPGRLSRAFEIFSSMEINTLHISIGEWTDEARKKMRVCLQAVGRYFLDTAGSAAILTSQQGKTGTSSTVVFSEHHKPDPNLTMLGAINRLTPETTQGLVKKISDMVRQADPSSPLNHYASVYEAIFAFKDLRKKLLRPSIEINNVRWLIAGKNEEVITQEKAQIGRLVMEKFGNSPQKAAELIESIYGSGFPDLEADALDVRLNRVTDFLDDIEGSDREDLVEKEVLDSVHDRLDQVPDEVFDNLSIGEPNVDGENEKEGAGEKRLRYKLFDMVSFFKRRSGTKKKMREMISKNIDFDVQDYETIAQDFGITPDDAGNLMELLKSCFDAKGHFVRAAFEKNIPAFAKYEKKVFEFLWYYLKEIMVRDDRVAFLNSIQTLISQMKQRKKALRVLLEDCIGSPEKISFSDRNALILANVLIRKYNKELWTDIEITPEEVLLVRDGLDRDVIKEIAPFLDEKQELVFGKVRRIHRKAKEMIDSGVEDKPVPLRYLFSLERECAIFLSLVGGPTAHKILHGVVQEYGNPESEIYHLTTSAKHMKEFMRLLQVSARGLGRFSEMEDITLLKEVHAAEEGFSNLTKAETGRYAVSGTMKWINKTIKHFGGKGVG